jgi:hypothetical protein
LNSVGRASPRAENKNGGRAPAAAREDARPTEYAAPMALREGWWMWGAQPSRLHRSASRGMEFAENGGSPQGVRRDAGHGRRDARAPRAKTEFGLGCGSTKMPRLRRYGSENYG